MILLWLLIVPLAAGPLAFFLRRRSVMEVVNLAAFAILLGLAAALGVQVLRSGPVSLWNGFFYADALSALVVLLTSFRRTRMFHLCRRLFPSGREKRSFPGGRGIGRPAVPFISCESTTPLRLCLFSP